MGGRCSRVWTRFGDALLRLGYLQRDDGYDMRFPGQRRLLIRGEALKDVLPEQAILIVAEQSVPVRDGELIEALGELHGHGEGSYDGSRQSK